MNRALRGVLAVVALTALAGGGTLAAQAISPEQLPVPAVAELPLSAAAAVPICPGPETLVTPDGARPVPPAGPVLVAAVAGGAGTLGDLRAPSGGGAPAPANPRALIRTGPLSQLSQTRDAAGAVRLDVATRSGGTPATAAAVQATLGRDGDLRGLAATGCSPATADAWLVGGGSADGERTRLLLANPTPSAALVDVFVHGPSGRAKAPSGEGIVVPAGGQVALFVDALAPGLAQTAVHVAARSGRVVATLHHTRVRGITPAGVDDVSPALAPAGTQVVPGVVVDSPGTAAVRVAVPGDAEAVVRVRLLPTAPIADPAPEALSGKGFSAVVNLAGGTVRDVPLTSAEDGTYLAVVEADVPVVAGAYVGQTLAGGELAGTRAALGKTVPPSEFGWAPSVAALRGTVLAAVPVFGGQVPSRASLVLGAPANRSRFAVREVNRTGAVSAERAVQAGAGQGVVVPLAAGTTAVMISPPGEPGTGGPVMASIVLQASDADGPMLSIVGIRPGPLPLGEPARVVRDDGIYRPVR